MVLYNSPYAVALLALGLLVAVIGIVRMLWSFHAISRSENQRTSDEESRSFLSPVLREVLRSEARSTLLVFIGIVVFSAVLVWAVKTDLGW